MLQDSKQAGLLHVLSTFQLCISSSLAEKADLPRRLFIVTRIRVKSIFVGVEVDRRE